MELEGSASFLLRACNDAIAKGVPLPKWFILSEVVRRTMRNYYDSGSDTECISSIDAKAPTSEGMALFYDAPKEITTDCQLEVSADLLKMIIADWDPEPLFKTRAMGLVSGVAQIACGDELKHSFTHFGMLHSPDQTDKTVQANLAF